MASQDSIIRVSVSEAARLFGISQQTVRRAIASNAVRYVVVRDRYKISFESLVSWSQKPTVRNKMERRGIGQFVAQWRIRNTRFSPNPKVFAPLPETRRKGQDTAAYQPPNQG